MQYLSILQKFTILELEGAAVVVGDRFLLLKEASEETDLGKEYLAETIGKSHKKELDTAKSKKVCNRAVTYHPVLLKSISVGGTAHRPEFQPNYNTGSWSVQGQFLAIQRSMVCVTMTAKPLHSS